MVFLPYQKIFHVYVLMPERRNNEAGDFRALNANVLRTSYRGTISSLHNKSARDPLQYLQGAPVENPGWPGLVELCCSGKGAGLGFSSQQTVLPSCCLAGSAWPGLVKNVSSLFISFSYPLYLTLRHIEGVCHLSSGSGLIDQLLVTGEALI